MVALTGGDSGGSRAALEEAGCTLKAAPGKAGEHSVALTAMSNAQWNTEPLPPEALTPGS